MKRPIAMATVMAIAVAGLQLAVPAEAHKGGRHCDTRMLAGRWIFATDIGHIADPETSQPLGEITALGTMNINRDGAVEGVFDATLYLTAFLPGNSYSGSAMLNRDCTGTLSFVTSSGRTRVDTIALVGRDEIWGMSQDTNNLWTYRVRRISKHHRRR